MINNFSFNINTTNCIISRNKGDVYIRARLTVVVGIPQSPAHGGTTLISIKNLVLRMITMMSIDPIMWCCTCMHARIIVYIVVNGVWHQQNALYSKRWSFLRVTSFTHVFIPSIFNIYLLLNVILHLKKLKRSFFTRDCIHLESECQYKFIHVGLFVHGHRFIFFGNHYVIMWFSIIKIKKWWYVRSHISLLGELRIPMTGESEMAWLIKI